jgi:hypothetical protein
MVNACNMVTSHCSVKHTSFTTETAQVADLPEMVGPSEVAGGRPERPVEIQCESENPPPLFGETSTHKTTPKPGQPLANLNPNDRAQYVSRVLECQTRHSVSDIRSARKSARRVTSVSSLHRKVISFLRYT